MHTIKAVPHISSFLPPIPTCFNFAPFTTTNYSIHTYKEKIRVEFTTHDKLNQLIRRKKNQHKKSEKNKIQATIISWSSYLSFP